MPTADCSAWPATGSSGPAVIVSPLDETAESLDLPADQLRRTWTALGLPDVPPDAPAVSIDERLALEGLPMLLSLIDETAWLDISASIAIGLGAIAEAASAVARSAPNMSVARTDSELTTAMAAARSAALVPWLGRFIDVMLRQHLLEARRRFEASDSYTTVEDQRKNLAVAFVDVSGYTAATEQMTAGQLCEMVRQFERVAIDAAQAGGGRVAKFVGDAAMIVAPAPEQLADVVTALLSRWDVVHDGSLGVRARLAYGGVTSRQGDYFGSPVNLAARLVAMAPRGTILAADSVADRLTAGPWVVGDVQSLDIRGFAERIDARTLTTGATTRTDLP